MAITLLQTAALTFIKISCLLFYHRIFRSASSVATLLIYTMIALISIWGVGYFLGFLFACKSHFDYFWTNLENQLKCPADFNQINLSLSVSDVIMDVILLIFPIPWVGVSHAGCGARIVADIRIDLENADVAGQENASFGYFHPRWSVCTCLTPRTAKSS